MNTIGLVAALVTFLSVWFGHVAVRKIESISPTISIPSTIFLALGIITGFFSLSTLNRPLSTALGILGVTLLFDALEFTRQQNRVKKGHAPANPNNPRHARILHDFPSATAQDLLKRGFVGNVVQHDETDHLISAL